MGPLQTEVQRLVEEGTETGNYPLGFEALTDMNNYPTARPRVALLIAVGAARAVGYLAERLDEQAQVQPQG